MKQIRQVLCISFIVLSFSNLLKAQTGFWNDFSSTDVSSWNPTVANTYIPSVVNNQLRIVAATSNYSNLEYKFSSQNISANPKLKIKIISPSSFTLRIDLRDVNGNFTSSSPVTAVVSQSSTLKRYVFDFTGKFAANNVDATKIVQASIFFNPGSSFNGTVLFDDFVLGDSIKMATVVPGNILINQLGYEKTGPKTAILQSTTSYTDTISFSLVNSTNQVVYKGKLGASQQVAGWTNRYFRIADFSAFQTEGTGYKLQIGGTTSYSFDIASNYLFNKTASSVIAFFNGMRSNNPVDNNLPFFDPNRTDKASVLGGWKDATGDPGKHMSHLSFANYFNPQQIPFVSWSLMKSFELNKTQYSTGNAASLQTEAAFGMDYLIKNIDAAGYLYLSVFDDWGGSTNRQVCEWGQPGGASSDQSARSANYQSAMREGGGMAVAALARAYNMNLTVGTNTPNTYLAGAVKLYTHLKSPGTGYKTKNLQYCNDHKENIIDYYCGMLAATELYRATKTASYQTDAANFAQKLMALQDASGVMYADSLKTRPFFHGADEGLPIIALVEYASIDPSKKAIVESFVQKWITRQYTFATKVTNPFLYPRQYFTPYLNNTYQAAKEGFFMPHNNETDYWWQGENARLASLATAMVVGARFIKPYYNFATDTVSQMAYAHMDWILGKNPFDMCMMNGFGTTVSPTYNGLTNVKAGICNGITSDVATETDIAWMPYDNSNVNGDAWQNWRWIEQWLPHDAWFLTAVSYINNNINNPYTDCNNVLGGTATIDSCKKCTGGSTGLTPILDPQKCSITGFEDVNQNLNSSVLLFPNPSRNTITINNALSETFDVRVVSLDGRETATYTKFTNGENIDISHYSPGMYTAIISYGNQTKFVKFAVVR